MTRRNGALASSIARPLLAALLCGTPAASARDAGHEILVRLIGKDEGARAAARVGVMNSRDKSWIPSLVDALFFASSEARIDVFACLERLSGERPGRQYRHWVEYVGGHEEIRPRKGYRGWKAGLFARIDPAFARFLDPSREMKIRPEEIIWGGVRKDGIPALKYPRAVRASEAEFLDDAETVFGIGVNGEYRAYPQRILDWHEMANDALGGQPFALSYCTLCGSAIAYGTRTFENRTLVFGSSGLLYRSNKLMYDEGTLSLWSNLTGEPVVGPLVGSGVSLPMLPLTVTTWKAWRALHPETTVVGPDTGFKRDYAPGAAYGRYFASPDAMFPVWKRSAVLEPKTWVYALRQGAASRAYPFELLLREKVVNDRVGSANVVLIADPESGTVRSYFREERVFSEGGAAELVEPRTGERWKVDEDGLFSASPGRAPLPRYAGHRAYWFGWYAFFPDTSVYEGCGVGLPGGR